MPLVKSREGAESRINRKSGDLPGYASRNSSKVKKVRELDIFFIGTLILPSFYEEGIFLFWAQPGPR